MFPCTHPPFRRSPHRTVPSERRMGKRWASNGQLAPGERRALPKEGSHQRFCRSPNGIRTRAATLRGRPGSYVETDPIRRTCSRPVSRRLRYVGSAGSPRVDGQLDGQLVVQAAATAVPSFATPPSLVAQALNASHGVDQHTSSPFRRVLSEPQRKQFHQPVADFQATRCKIATGPPRWRRAGRSCTAWPPTPGCLWTFRCRWRSI
jgi:hypothetical protein